MAKNVLTSNEPSRAASPPDVDKKAFGRRLHQIMLAKNLTQSDLARAAGMDRMRISSYVRGQSLPTPLFLKKLAEALSIDPNELLPDVMPTAAPLYSTAVSPDGRKMRLVADVWVPTPVGAQIVHLLSENATANRA